MRSCFCHGHSGQALDGYRQLSTTKSLAALNFATQLEHCRQDATTDRAADGGHADRPLQGSPNILQSKVGNRIAINVNDHTIAFDWKDPYQIQTGANSGADSGEIKATMPGRVVKILVKKDQEVEAGQSLLVLEAMKMENEIKASRAGTISNIHVTEAASVESGALLVSME